MANFEDQITPFQAPLVESVAPQTLPSGPDTIQPDQTPGDVEEFDADTFDLTPEEDAELNRLPPQLAAKIRTQKERLFDQRQKVAGQRAGAEKRGQQKGEVFDKQLQDLDRQVAESNEVAKRQGDHLQMLTQDQEREIAGIKRGQNVWYNQSTARTAILSVVGMISLLTKGRKDPAAVQNVVAMMNNQIARDDAEGLRRTTVKKQAVRERQQLIDRLSSSQAVAEQQSRALKIQQFKEELLKHRESERDSAVLAQYDQVLAGIDEEYENATTRAAVAAEEEGRKRVQQEIGLEKSLVDIQAKRAGIEKIKAGTRTDQNKEQREQAKLQLAERKEQREIDELTIPTATDTKGTPIRVTNKAAAREFNTAMGKFSEQNQVAQDLLQEVTELGNTAKLGDRFTLKGEKLKQLYGKLRRTLTEAGGAALSESEVKEILAPLGGGKVPIRASLFKQQLRLFQRLNKTTAIARLGAHTSQDIGDIDFKTIKTKKAKPRKVEQIAAKIKAANINKETGVVIRGGNPVSRRTSAENRDLRSNIKMLDKLAKSGNKQAKRLLEKVLAGNKGDFAKKVLKGE